MDDLQTRSVPVPQFLRSLKHQILLTRRVRHGDQFDVAKQTVWEHLHRPNVELSNCQEELYYPELDVSINPNENSILTPLRTVPDVRLGYTSTGQSKIIRGKRAVVSHERPFR